MDTTGHTPEALSPRLAHLGKVMRRMPVDIRKVQWWWTKLYARIGGGGFSEDPVIDARWPAGLQAPVKCANHPLLMRFNLQDWMERRAYFSGALYQRELEDFLIATVRSGDQFLDIGANIGLVTLLAADRVGVSGRVIACEANPVVFERLQEHVALNKLGDFVELVSGGLGAEPGVAHLSLDGAHAGKGTLTGEGGVEVPVRTGDDVFASLDHDKPLFMKIDVEGFEGRVLSGMPTVLAHPNAAMVIEITDHVLSRVGDSAQGLYDTLHAHGFVGYRLGVDKQRFACRPTLTPSPAAEADDQYDAFFVKQGSPMAARIAGAGLVVGA